jgi:hypothetical protein
MVCRGKRDEKVSECTFSFSKFLILRVYESVLFFCLIRYKVGNVKLSLCHQGVEFFICPNANFTLMQAHYYRN